MTADTEDLERRIRAAARAGSRGLLEDWATIRPAFTAKALMAAEAEIERLRACIRAEVDQHFKVQDQHGHENAGPPYCAADSFLWPCPVRRRLESALDRKDTA